MATKHISDIQVLLAQKEWRQNQQGPWACQILVMQTGEPPKVCIRAMERAHGRGLLEYGVSLRTAWLTQKGADLIQEYLWNQKEITN